MAIEALTSISYATPVTAIAAINSNPFARKTYEKALQNAGFKFNENPSLLSNPQASMCVI